MDAFRSDDLGGGHKSAAPRSRHSQGGRQSLGINLGELGWGRETPARTHSVDQARTVRRRCGHADLLTDDGGRKRTERIQGSQHSQARVMFDPRTDGRIAEQMRIDHARGRLQIQPAPHTRDVSGDLAETRPGGQAECEDHGSRAESDRDSGVVQLCRAHDRVCRVCRVDVIDSGDGVSLQPTHDLSDRVGRSKRQSHREVGDRRRLIAGRAHCPAQLARGDAELGAHDVVELPHRTEPRRERDVGQRQRGVFQQQSGCLGSAGARQLPCRRADLRGQRTIQVSLRDVECPGNRLDTALIRGPGTEQAQRTRDQVRPMIPLPGTGQGVRTAAPTRTQSSSDSCSS